MATAIFYDGRYLDHDTGADHPERGERLEAIMGGIKARGLLEGGSWRLIKPERVAKDTVELVHDPVYIDFIERFCSSGGGAIDEDTVACESTYDVALLAIGGAVEAALEVLQGRYANAFALVRPPGHHVGRCGRALGAPSQGFCIFNNIAIAAMRCLEEGAERVLILDIDAHHGNGTQEIFENCSDVLFVSLHQQGIYPFSGSLDEIGYGGGRGYTVNVPMPRGAGDDVYLTVFRELLRPLAESYKPDLILVSAGFDAHSEDGIAQLRLSDAGYLAIFDEIQEVARGVCSGRLVAILEGGYNPDVLFRLVPRVLERMGGHYEGVGRLSKSPPSVVRKVKLNLRKLREILSKYHNLGSQ